jgi:cell division protein FtsZ
MDALKFAIQEEVLAGTKIKVVGVGGGGSNAVARMMNEGLQGVEFHILNTDVQALNASQVPNKLAIGSKVTNGLGAGSDPALGRQAALEDTERIIEVLEGADMVFVTAGLGGGTGTGAAPVVASLAKELNALTVAVVTKPFAFEGPRRMKQADRGLSELGGTVDTVITVPNDRLLELVPRGTSFFEAFRIADDILRQAVQGISDIITTPGLINRDFSDIRAIMLGMGYAMMGTAAASGENASIEAARQAISSPLMEEGGVKGARGVLINITGSSKLSLHDVNEACSLIRSATANEDAQINFGVVMNEALKDTVKITVIATGFQRDNLPQLARRATASASGSAYVEPIVFENAPLPPPAPMPAPVTEPLFSSGLSSGSSLFRDMPPPPEPVEEPEMEEQAPMAMPDDIEVPAFMRRERRLYQ